MSRRTRIRVLVPEELLTERPAGALFGYHHPSTGTFNVVSWGEAPAHRPGVIEGLGRLVTDTEDAGPGDGLLGRFVDDRLELTYGGEACQVEAYRLTSDVFSRNSGILETDRMLDRGAVLCGCGSVGSLVALELARAGVGRFLLIDQDVFSYVNVCRHQCGISDVGRTKVEALRERILDIHPGARVACETRPIENLEREVFDRWCDRETVVVGCADNRQADLYANRIACLYEAPFVSIGLWERAFAGEVFWCVPGEGPCYNCVFGAQAQVLSNRPSVNRRIYTTEERSEAASFEPGIAADIGWVTLVGVKLILDLLSREDREHRPRVLAALEPFTLLCNTTDGRSGGELAEIFDHPLQITRSITVDRDPDCEHCAFVGVELARLGGP